MPVSVAVCEIFSVKEWCDLENSDRHLQSNKPPFGPSRWHVHPANQDTAWLAKVPCCCCNCLEHCSSLSALAIHLSRTIIWVEIPSLQPSLHQPLRTICFKSELTYLLTLRDRRRVGGWLSESLSNEFRSVFESLAAVSRILRNRWLVNNSSEWVSLSVQNAGPGWLRPTSWIATLCLAVGCRV